jgi:hypothetical protein
MEQDNPMKQNLAETKSTSEQNWNKIITFPASLTHYHLREHYLIQTQTRSGIPIPNLITLKPNTKPINNAQSQPDFFISITW